MADTVVVHPCRFLWNISNPFVPLRRMAATFYHGYPSLKQWKVTIQPSLDRGVTFWNFSFSLLCVTAGEDDTVETDRLEVNISLDGRNMESKNKLHFSFSERNWHTYRFDFFVNTGARRDNQPHQLAIEVNIFFPNGTIPNQVNAPPQVNTPRFNDEDLTQLSDDMRRLLANHFYSDMNLRILSTDTPTDYPVHSYILLARWCNFLRMHPPHTMVNNTISINMSDLVLRGILIYVYSGQLGTGCPNWGTLPCITELFQAIDRYYFYHLYQAYVRDDSQQVRTTTMDLTVNPLNCPLDAHDGTPLHRPAYMWRVNPGTNYEFYFQIQFFLDAGEPWFLYNLHSRSSIRIHAQVYLLFKKGFVGQRVVPSPVHRRDYTIDPNGFAHSGTCHFPRNSAIRNFIAGDRRDRKGRMKRYIGCILYFSDGTSSIQVQNEGGIQLQSDRERYEVLSNHMYKLMSFQPDLRIICPSQLPIVPYLPHEPFNAHKGILALRVPQWWRREFPEGNEIPAVRMLNLEGEIFRYIYAYIYTGKAFHIRNNLLDEVGNAAAAFGLHLLRNLVDELRPAAQNQ